MKVGVKVAQQTGLDPEAAVCPHHRLKSLDEVKTILMQQFKIYKYNPKSKKDELDRIGIVCPRCGFAKLLGKSTEQRLMVPKENEGNVVKTPEELSPTLLKTV